jgi:uncharacterized membrane protein YeiH
MRDIVCNEVRMVFRDGKPHAICAFPRQLEFLLPGMSGFPHDFALWSSAMFIVVFRRLAWRFDLRLGR